MKDTMSEAERNAEIASIFERNMCTQCHKNPAFLTEVCMSCARKNHKRAARGFG